MKQGVELAYMQEDNVIDLTKAKQFLQQTAGKEPPHENWLADLVPGTIFVSQPKKNQAQKFLDQFCVAEHKGGVSNLIQKLATGQQVDLWYPTLPFSRDNTLVEVLSVVQFGYSAEQAEIDEALPDNSFKENEDGSDQGAV